MGNSQLTLRGLSDRHPGITPALSDAYLEAACVCLDRHHKSPTDFDMDNNGTASTAIVHWDTTNPRAHAAWGNQTDTTEVGAYTFAIASVELLRSLFAVSRAETRTGADYYLSASPTAPPDLEDCIRLEVSGTDTGDRAVIVRRVKQKLAQADKGESELPAIAVVVGFAQRLVLIQDLGVP